MTPARDAALARACVFVMSTTLALGGCAAGPGGAGPVDAAPGPMVTDRPDFTESASTVAPGHAQLEAGYTRATGGSLVTHEIGETLVRVGLTGAAELRVGIGSWRIEAPDDPAGTTTSGLAGSSLGVKLRLPGTPLAPEAAVLVGTTVPVSTRFGDPGWTPSAVLAGAWSAGPVGLGANVGYAHAETDAGRGEILASVAAGFPFPPDERVGLFLETWGVAPARGGDAQVVVDGGATFALSPDVQLDLRVGRAVSGRTETVVGVGVAVRR